MIERPFKIICTKKTAGTGREDSAADVRKNYETCVCCRKRVTVFADSEIEFRPFYIEGAGQLCYDCYHELYTTKG